MSTPSSITVKVGDEYKGIYCHWDGYLSNNGKLLLDHYNSQEGAESIVALGDLSCLEASVECPPGHNTDTPVDGYSVASGLDGYSIAFGRDCLEDKDDVKALTDSTYDGLMGSLEQSYNYLWDGERWMVDGEELTQELIDEEGD